MKNNYIGTKYLTSCHLNRLLPPSTQLKRNPRLNFQISKFNLFFNS